MGNGRLYRSIPAIAPGAAGYSLRMFEVLAFLCDHYGHVDLPPALDVLTPRLNALGYDQVQIDDANDWLNDLSVAADEWYSPASKLPPSTLSSRVYTVAEMAHLGTSGIGQLARWVHEGQLPSLLHEMVLDRAMATPDSPLLPAQLHLVVQMVCWRFGHPPKANQPQALVNRPAAPVAYTLHLH